MNISSNKKLRMMCIVLMVLLGFNAYAGGKKLTIGNNKNSVTSYEPVKGDSKAGSALFFDSDYMSAYKGCELTEVTIAFADKTESDAITIFLSHAIDGEPFYQQTVSASKSKWNTFKLSTPYVIDGSNLYVGYTVSGVKYLGYGKALVKNPEYILGKDGVWKEYKGKNSASLLATISGDNLPENNVRLGTTNIPSYVKTDVPMDIFGDFQNLGATNVTSLVFGLYDGDEEICEEKVDGFDVAPRSEGSFSLSSMRLNAECEKDLRLFVKSVNGGVDAVEGDNSTKTCHVMCRDSYVARKVLLETFSTEKCTACPKAHKAIDKVTRDMEDIVEIDHHAGFYTDKYTIDESVEYEWFYPSYYQFAPAMLVDRMDMRDVFPEVYNYETPILNADASTLKALYEMELQRPAFATVNITTDWSAEARKLSIDVSGKQLLPVATPDSVRLYVFVTEDSLYSTSQAGASKGFYHSHVPRLSLTPTWGEKVDIAAGYDCHFDAVLNEEWNEKQMNVVAFVANYNSTNPCDCAVLNVEQQSLKTLTSGINNLRHGVTGAWQIIDMSGYVVGKGIGSETFTKVYDALKHGVYVVSINGENGMKTNRKVCK